MKSILKAMMITGSAVAALAAAPAEAAPEAAAVKVATVEGISEYKLPNGLSVILFPDASKPDRKSVV